MTQGHRATIILSSSSLSLHEAVPGQETSAPWQQPGHGHHQAGGSRSSGPVEVEASEDACPRAAPCRPVRRRPRCGCSNHAEDVTTRGAGAYKTRLISQGSRTQIQICLFSGFTFVLCHRLSHSGKKCHIPATCPFVTSLRQKPGSAGREVPALTPQEEFLPVVFPAQVGNATSHFHAKRCSEHGKPSGAASSVTNPDVIQLRGQ